MNAIETKSWERYEMYMSVAFVNNEWWKQQTNEYWNMNDGEKIAKSIDIEKSHMFKMMTMRLCKMIINE